MAKILVTGGTGFLGVPLVEKLNELGHDLKLLVRETSDLSPFQKLKNIEYVIGDVRDTESLYKAVENVDLIYHLAAYTRMWARDKSIFEDININGTSNIAKIA
ncbi:MAG: NAD-dependent epimerase/dehydratase family protein, partial [Promethearchaeota archaeon]